jgi:hypothetical protein
MSFEVKAGKVWLYGGINWRRIALGFEINDSWISVDFLFFWFSIEYWGAFRRNSE